MDDPQLAELRTHLAALREQLAALQATVEIQGQSIADLVTAGAKNAGVMLKIGVDYRTILAGLAALDDAARRHMQGAPPESAPPLDIGPFDIGPAAPQT
jgi:hypothetical protein